MAVAKHPFASLSLVFLLLICAVSRPYTEAATAPTGCKGDTWCVADPDAAEEIVKYSMDLICTYKFSCHDTVEGQPCYEPNTTYFHASYVFNEEYKRGNCAEDLCTSLGAGIVVNYDPSTATCHFR